MKKLINRVLKLVGLNLVRAKRRKTTKWQTLPIGPSGVAALPPYTREELEKCPLDAKCNQLHVPLSDYMGQSEWENTAPVAVPVPGPGKTHYVGDDCPGGHKDCFKSLERPRVEQPHSDNKIGGPTS